MKHKVLVTDHISEAARAFLVENFEIVQDSQQAEALLTRSRTKIDKQFLDRAPHLKVVVTATSGFNHIDLLETQNRGIKVAYTPEANAASAAEITWGLVLACARQIQFARDHIAKGFWNQKLTIGSQLEGKTYGVIGLGRIGIRVAKVAYAFGMRVMAFDPYNENFPGYVSRRGLEELLRESDVISLHVPLTRETRKMINGNTLEGISDTTILVNTSRGEVIDEVALLHAVREGEIGAVGLDVFEREPVLADSKFLKFENVIMTPHIGARTEEAYEKASMEAALQIASFFKTSDLAHPLPPKALWYEKPQGFN